MRKLSLDYKENVKYLDTALRVSESFDLLKKTLAVGGGELTLYFIDGFVKDTVMQKLMMHFLSVKKLPSSAGEFMRTSVPYVECDVTEDADAMIRALLSGQTLLLGSSFGAAAILRDSRT